MKRDRTLIFTKILYALFAAGTVISMFIVYSDAEDRMAYKFLLGYVLLAFLMLLYIPMITLINSRKMKSTEVRKRILRFIALFIVFSGLNFGFDSLIRPTAIDAFRIFSNALGMSFGISFLDVVFLRKTEPLKGSVSK